MGIYRVYESIYNRKMDAHESFFPGKPLVKNIQIHSQTSLGRKQQRNSNLVRGKLVLRCQHVLRSIEMFGLWKRIECSLLAMLREDQNRFHIFVATYGFIKLAF